MDQTPFYGTEPSSWLGCILGGCLACSGGLRPTIGSSRSVLSPEISRPQWTSRYSRGLVFYNMQRDSLLIASLFYKYASAFNHSARSLHLSFRNSRRRFDDGRFLLTSNSAVSNHSRSSAFRPPFVHEIHRSGDVPANFFQLCTSATQMREYTLICGNGEERVTQTVEERMRKLCCVSRVFIRAGFYLVLAG